MRLFSLILCIFFAAVAAKTELDTLLMNAVLSEADPTAEPTAAPSLRPTKMPTAVPTTAAPSMVPTAVPTAMPTPINLVKFEAKQTLSGVSPEDYLANKASVDHALQNAIAATMTGVEPDDVTDIGIDASGSGTRRLATGDEVRLRYMVVAHVDGATYDSLVAQLTTASETNVLSALIQEYADEFGVPVLADATASAPETTNLLYDRGTSELLTGTQIAGLIIGIFLCLGLIATVVFFILNVHNAGTAAATGSSGASADAPATGSTTLELTNQV